MIYKYKFSLGQPSKPKWHCYLMSDWIHFDQFLLFDNFHPNTKFLSLYPDSIKEYNDNIKQCKTAEEILKFWYNWFTENYPEFGFKYNVTRC